MDKQHNFRHGRGSDEQHRQDQALFKELLREHGNLKRQTLQIEDGIISTTTANTPELVKILQDHVAGMEKRFGMDRAIRSWDPLFAALFEYKDQITMTYKNIENGIEATLTSDNPKQIGRASCRERV